MNLKTLKRMHRLLNLSIPPKPYSFAVVPTSAMAIAFVFDEAILRFLILGLLPLTLLCIEDCSVDFDHRQHPPGKNTPVSAVLRHTK